MLHRNLLKSYEIIYTSEVAKIGKVFTKRIYLFDSVSMERLKSAAQSALTKRKLKHCVKERADGMPTGYGKSLIFYAVAIRTGTVRRFWFAIRTAMGIFLAIVGEILVFFDFYNITLVKQQ